VSARREPRLRRGRRNRGNIHLINPIPLPRWEGLSSVAPGLRSHFGGVGLAEEGTNGRGIFTISEYKVPSLLGEKELFTVYYFLSPGGEE